MKNSIAVKKKRASVSPHKMLTCWQHCYLAKWKQLVSRAIEYVPTVLWLLCKRQNPSPLRGAWWLCVPWHDARWTWDVLQRMSGTCGGPQFFLSYHLKSFLGLKIHHYYTWTHWTKAMTTCSGQARVNPVKLRWNWMKHCDQKLMLKSFCCWSYQIISGIINILQDLLEVGCHDSCSGLKWWTLFSGVSVNYRKPDAGELMM